MSEAFQLQTQADAFALINLLVTEGCAAVVVPPGEPPELFLKAGERAFERVLPNPEAPIRIQAEAAGLGLTLFPDNPRAQTSLLRRALAGLRHFTVTHPDSTVQRIISYPAVVWHPGHKKYIGLAAGHHPDRGLFAVRGAPIQPTGAPSNPTHLVNFLDGLMLEGPHRTNYLAFLLGTVLRAEIDLLPGLLLRSPFKRTGKTTAGKLAAAMHSGDPDYPTCSFNTDAELAKYVSMQARDATALIFLDNLTGELYSPLLANALSSRRTNHRLLGTATRVVFTDPVIIVTTQSGTVNEDLTDRFLYVALDNEPPKHLPHGDLRLYVTNHHRAIYAELLGLLDSSPGPLDIDQAPAGFRHTTFWRHVAPALTAAGYDPKDLLGNLIAGARPELIELAQLLVSPSWRTVSDIANDPAIPHTHYLSNIIGFKQDDRDGWPAKRLKRLITQLPDTLSDQVGVYRIESTTTDKNTAVFRATLTERS